MTRKPKVFCITELELHRIKDRFSFEFTLSVFGCVIASVFASLSVYASLSEADWTQAVPSLIAGAWLVFVCLGGIRVSRRIRAEIVERIFEESKEQ